MKFIYRASTAAAVVLTALASAGAASAADLVVGFSTTAAVPLSPWMIALLTAAIGGVAVMVFSKRKGVGGGVATLALLASASLFTMDQAHAAPPSALQLSTSSPATYTSLPTASGSIVVTNVNAETVSLTSITITGIHSERYVITGTGCEVAGILAASQSCLVSFTYIDPV